MEDWRNFNKEAKEVFSGLHKMEMDLLNEFSKDNIMEWINVKNELPKKGVDVIIFSNGFVEWKMAHLDKYGWTYGGANYIKTITHWMKKPEPPN